jgi:hypothetical protein
MEICPDDGTVTIDEKLFKSDTPADLTGQVFNNRYLINSLIGQGGMGAVYKATQISLNQTVALKLMNQKIVSDISQIKRFHQEARLASSLTSPHTIKIFDFGHLPNGLLYMAMEYLEGVSLSKTINREAPLQWERVIHIAKGICLSLHEAHSKGFIHRDLKPENIFLMDAPGEPDFVKVLDFGIAKVLPAENGPEQSRLTDTGMVIGSAYYMSPEQIKMEPLDHRSDLYALGIVIYEMLTGLPPFMAETNVLIMYKQVHEPVPLITEEVTAEKVPENLLNAVYSLLEKNRDKRPQSAKEAIAMLDAVKKESSHEKETLFVDYELGQQSAETVQVIPPEVLKPARGTDRIENGTRLEKPVLQGRPARKILFAGGILLLAAGLLVLFVFPRYHEVTFTSSAGIGNANQPDVTEIEISPVINIKGIENQADVPVFFERRNMEQTLGTEKKEIKKEKTAIKKDKTVLKKQTEPPDKKQDMKKKESEYKEVDF